MTYFDDHACEGFREFEPGHDDDHDSNLNPSPNHDYCDTPVEFTDLTDISNLTDFDDDVPSGREANAVFWRNFFDSVPDLETELEDLAILGDEVVGRILLRGTHTGDRMGIAATGRRVELRTVDVWDVADRILAGHWSELPQLRLFRQLRRSRDDAEEQAT
jgi:predicted ester cyclase